MSNAMMTLIVVVTINVARMDVVKCALHRHHHMTMSVRFQHRNHTILNNKYHKNHKYRDQLYLKKKPEKN